MRPVQLILIGLLILVTSIYFSRLRSGVLDRLIILCFVVLGAVMTVAPDLTTAIAHLVGVGRGVDLFFYLAILGLGFMWLLLFSKIRDLQSSITNLTRALALKKEDAADDLADKGSD
ncbi:MAG: DUF2304 domain-containing protein [Candidatus Latescibacterota bacterium]|jgi:hypothetical protein